MIHPDCLWIPSPNYGYPRGGLGQLGAAIEAKRSGGEFWHSMVGSLVAAKHRFLNPAEEASAHFLFPRDGVPTQMIDSEDVAWHSGNYLANLHFHGFEFEGGAPGNLSEPLTENQIEWGIRITEWLRIAHRTPKIYIRRETLWEHREVQATSCPSGRIPWERLIQEMEDKMTDKEFEERFLATMNSLTFRPVNDEGVTIKWRPRTIPQWMGQLVAVSDKEKAHDGTPHGGGGAHGHPHQHGEAG